MEHAAYSIDRKQHRQNTDYTLQFTLATLTMRTSLGGHKPTFQVVFESAEGWAFPDGCW